MREIMQIMLTTTNDVKEVVNRATTCPYQIDLCRGRYVVDAKSLMGIFSLDLTQPLTVKVPLNVNESVALNLFDKWEV